MNLAVTANVLGRHHVVTLDGGGLDALGSPGSSLCVCHDHGSPT